jgi:transposase
VGIVRLPSNLPINGHSFRRVEVLTGDERRRRWSVAEKAAIVAESLAPGAVSSAVALRHGLHRNQLYAWRREFRSAAVADAGVPELAFVPVIAQERVAVGNATVEIEIGGVILRAGPGTDLGFLGEVIGVLKATA